MEPPLWMIGVVGGAGIELAKWIPIQDQLHEDYPDWAKGWGYWMVGFAKILLGAFLVEAHIRSGDVSLNWWLAFHIGASGPLILAAAVSRSPALVVPGSR